MSEDGVTLTALHGDNLEVAVTMGGQTDRIIVSGTMRQIITRAVAVAHQTGLARGMLAEREISTESVRNRQARRG